MMQGVMMVAILFEIMKVWTRVNYPHWRRELMYMRLLTSTCAVCFSDLSDLNTDDSGSRSQEAVCIVVKLACI